MLYVSTGAILWMLGRDLGHPRIHGYGEALVLQGAFLYVFDVAMMLGHERLLRRMAPHRARIRGRPAMVIGLRRGLAPEPTPWRQGRPLAVGAP